MKHWRPCVTTGFLENLLEKETKRNQNQNNDSILKKAELVSAFFMAS